MACAGACHAPGPGVSASASACSVPIGGCGPGSRCPADRSPAATRADWCRAPRPRRLARRLLEHAAPRLQRLVAHLRIAVGEALSENRLATLDVGARRHHRQAPDLGIVVGDPRVELRPQHRAARGQRQRREAPDACELVGILGAALELARRAQPVERRGLELRDLAALARQRLETFGGAEQRVDLNGGGAPRAARAR